MSSNSGFGLDTEKSCPQISKSICMNYEWLNEQWKLLMFEEDIYETTWLGMDGILKCNSGIRNSSLEYESKFPFKNIS